MKELGFISPRTHFIDLTVNGVSYRAIAQENPVKEMLENNKRRESAVLEVNEDFLWNRFSRQWHSPKIINSNWLKKNKLNVDIGIDALNLFSIATNEVDSSGRLVPTATNVNAITLSLTPKSTAIVVTPEMSQSAPNFSIRADINKINNCSKMLDLKLLCFSSSFPTFDFLIIVNK